MNYGAFFAIISTDTCFVLKGLISVAEKKFQLFQWQPKDLSRFWLHMKYGLVFKFPEPIKISGRPVKLE